MTFDVGTANAYSPITEVVHVTGLAGTYSQTVKAVEGQHPSIHGSPVNALQRWWTITQPTGGPDAAPTADITFHYRGDFLPNGDVVGTEALYKIFKYNGSFTSFTADASGSNSPSDHFKTLNNVASFSDWTLAEPSAVTPGTLAFLNAPYTGSETNANHNKTITVRRSGGSDGAVSVHYATSAGTATAGSDYTAVSGDLTWNDGVITDQTFNIPIIADTVFEGDETVNITLSVPTAGAAIVGTNPTTLTITNDDTADTSAAVDGSGNLIISDVGGNTNDTLTISFSGSNLVISDGGHTLNCTAPSTFINASNCEFPLSSITGSIQVNTGEEMTR